MALQIIEPPAGYKPNGPKELREKGTAWCPYCGRESEFGYDARLNNARCMACGISERDFYVRRFNSLWDDKALEALVAGAMKSGRKWVMPYPWEKGKDNQQEPEPAKKTFCARCEKEITATSNSRKYCRECAAAVERENARERVRKMRSKDKSPAQNLG